MTTKLLALLPLVLVLGCPPDRDPASPNPAVCPDTNFCPAMCDHLRVLSCEEGKPLYVRDRPGPQGVPNTTCEEFCERQQSRKACMNPRCLAKVPDCGSIEAWRNKSFKDPVCAQQ